MEIRLIGDGVVDDHPVEDLAELLRRDDGLLWVDIPECDCVATHALAEVFGFHPMAIRDATERNRVPKLHAYPDHVFVILHARSSVGADTCTTSNWTSSSVGVTW
jgi:magnesium transporter